MKPSLKTQTPPVSTPEPPLPQSEKTPPTRIVVLERKTLLAGSSTADFYPAQMIVDPFSIGLVIAHNVRYHDVSNAPTPTRILIRRDQSIQVGRGVAQVRSGEIVVDPWVIAACRDGSASFDDVSGDEAA